MTILLKYLIVAGVLIIVVGVASLWVWLVPVPIPPEPSPPSEMQPANTGSDPVQEELQPPQGRDTQAFPAPASPLLLAQPPKSMPPEPSVSPSESRAASKPEASVPPAAEPEVKESSTIPEPSQKSLPPLPSPATRRPTSSLSKRPAAPSKPKRPLLAGKAPSREPKESVTPPTKPRAEFTETLIPRRPAQRGLYETITVATARSAPSDSATMVDRIQPGMILNVTGSERDWLVVYSKGRKITVYVKRDEAMYSANQSPWDASSEVPESGWKEIEGEIQRAFAKRGVQGVSVSFIGDTAYLKGTVKTEIERNRAEIAAHSIPEVKHIFNGLRVNRTWHFEVPD